MLNSARIRVGGDGGQEEDEDEHRHEHLVVCLDVQDEIDAMNDNHARP